jgi:predicted RNA-binding protein with PUA-like domain
VNYWLFKTEPETYSFEQLLRDKKTNWDHVRNYQARNFLRQVARGDRAMIYHSGDVKAVVGVAECVREAYPDVDPDGGDWVQIDLKPVKAASKPVTLAQIKASAALKDIPLIRQSRLSCMPITADHFQTLLKLAETRL